MTKHDIAVLRRISRQPYISAAELAKKPPNSQALSALLRNMRRDGLISGIIAGVTTTLIVQGILL